MTHFTKITLCTAAVVLAAAASRAATPPNSRCEVGKLKVVASYATCRLKADAKAVLKGGSPDFTLCDDKINSKFPKLEAQAGAGVCPSESDVADIKGRTDNFTTTIATLLSGGELTTTTTTTTTLPPGSCGDGNLNGGEQCDVGNLNGKTCATVGHVPPFYNGTLACGPGCQFDTSGCNLTRFEDLGATVLDNQTGLEWEKKTDDGSIHDKDNTYTWEQATSPGTQPTTPDTTQFLPNLNGKVTHGLGNTDSATNPATCFDQHCDWRLPNVDELKSMTVLECGTSPCIYDVAFIPTQGGGYWTNSIRAANTIGAYIVNFSNGTVAADSRTTPHFARAVRR